MTLVTSEASRTLLDDDSDLTIKTIPTLEMLYEGDSAVVKQPINGDSQELHQKRLDGLKQVFSDMEPKPDMFISEFWPLGFRYFEQEELLPFMDYMREARNDIQFGTFLRDYNMLNQVPDNSADGRVQLLNDKFDFALFRGDEKLVPLHLSFEGAESNITIPHQHVGYMINPDEITPSEEEPMVVVAAGGSNYPHTDTFLKQALKARKHSSNFSHTPWRVYVSKSTPKKLMNELKGIALQEPDGDMIDIRPTDDSFLGVLKNSKFALLRGGSSAIEAAAMHVPTILFPHGEGMAEQVVRSKALSDYIPYVSMVSLDELSDEQSFARHIDDTYTPCAALSQRKIKVNGAENAANNIIEYFNGREMTLPMQGRKVC